MRSMIYWVGLMGGFYILVFGAQTGNRHEMVLESVPGVILVDLWSICQAGAVGKVPGAKFGRKPTQNRN